MVITPAVAAPNTARTITVNGLWPNGCVPGNPSIEEDRAGNTLVFKLFVPQTFVACTHSLGLIAGPTVGSAMMAWAGADGLLAGLSVTLSAGVAAVAYAGFTTVMTPEIWRQLTLRSTAGHIA